MSAMCLAFMSFGFSEMLLIGVVALLVFGGNLPDVMRSLGRSYAKLRQSLNEFSRPVREQMREVTQLPPPSTPPVGAGEEPAAPDDYPDYYDALPDEGPDEGPESDGPDDAADEPAPEAEEKRAKTPPPPSGPDIDEPPPV